MAPAWATEGTTKLSNFHQFPDSSVEIGDIGWKFVGFHGSRDGGLITLYARNRKKDVHTLSKLVCVIILPPDLDLP